MFDMNKNIQEELDRIENFNKILGEYLGYIGEPCCNCGRYRVQKFSSGALVCEKCCTDQNTKLGYENEYGTYLELCF